LCQQGERQGTTRVILWPLWREGAMKLGDAAHTQAYLQTSGQRALENTEAFDVFDRALAGDALQTLVLAGKPERVSQFLGMTQPLDAGVSADPHPTVVRPLTVTGSFTESRVTATKTPVLFAQTLRGLAAHVLRASEDELDLNTSFADFGFDSILLTRFARQLSAQLGVEVQAALLFSYGTLEKLTEHLLSQHPDLLERHAEWLAQVPVRLQQQPVSRQQDRARLQQQTVLLQQVPVRLQQSSESFESPAELVALTSAQSAFGSEVGKQDDPIAVIAASGRFPGAANIEDLWKNLCEGRSGLGQMPSARVTPGLDDQSDLTAGYLQDVELFDPRFFSIPPHEANLMDPRHRLFLQTAWHTLERAGYTGVRLKNIRCGVYVGVEESHEGLFPKQGYINSQQIATLAARIAYHLDLSGPALALSTACS
jgi:acyl transferase domain-containing protein